MQGGTHLGQDALPLQDTLLPSQDTHPYSLMHTSEMWPEPGGPRGDPHRYGERCKYHTAAQAGINSLFIIDVITK